MKKRSLSISAFAFVMAAVLLFCLAARAQSAPAVSLIPQALADLRGFRGTITYVAHRDGVTNAAAISGSLVIDNGWTLDEHTSRYELHADARGASMDFGDDQAAVDDLFAADSLANAWAAALAEIATQPIRPGSGASVWECAGGLRVFVDSAGGRVIGLSDVGSADQVGYVFDDWTRNAGIDMPLHVMRLVEGRPDAAYTIDQYAVTAVPGQSSGRAVSQELSTIAHPSDATALLPGAYPGSLDLPLRLELAWLASLIVIAVFAMLWSGRDALVLNLCRRMAHDPRGWRRAGVSIFVGPDGALAFDGMNYRVGPHFYNRAALVQQSVLFLRISAPGAPRAVILPRKFRPIDLGIKARPARRTASGFTLVETIVATALFTSVIMLGIYPALLALSRADALAQERAEAVVIASNALADEQTADYYDTGAPQGTTVTQIDGLTLSVTVNPALLRATSDLDITVTDSTGDILAHVTSLLGPPVKAPPDSGGGPPGG